MNDLLTMSYYFLLSSLAGAAPAAGTWFLVVEAALVTVAFLG